MEFASAEGYRATRIDDILSAGKLTSTESARGIGPQKTRMGG
jgi:hypothetical protein